ncbi:MAG: hypothetical protein CMD92_07040 [Gammaproteobacteria bacterium]|nr:hypothetical protein [Gammaproteobacteria bacterium]
MAGIHGSVPDRVSMTGVPSQPKAPEEQPQRRAPEPDPDYEYDAAAIDDSERDHAAANQQQRQQELPQFTEEDDCAFSTTDSAIMAAADATERAHRGEASTSAAAVLEMANRVRDSGAPQEALPPQQQQQVRPLTPAQQAEWKNRHNERLEAARGTNGQSAGTPVLITRFMRNGLSRDEAAAGAKVLAERREIRAEMSRRALAKTIRADGESQKQQVAKLLTDKRDEETKEPQMRLPSTGNYINAERAAAACLPDTQEVMSSGYEEQFVRDVVDCKPTQTFGNDHVLVGHANTPKWEYKVRPTEGMNKPADYDFNWARLRAFGNGEGQDAAGGQKNKSVYVSTAAEVKKESSEGKHSLINTKSMTKESIRDTIYQMAQRTSDNKMRIPRHASTEARQMRNQQSCMLSGEQDIKDATKPPSFVHPHCMYDADFKKANRYDMRLDYLVDKRALPSCILPESFEKGVPIAECENGNGVYFNKYIASEHAALKVESAQYLSTVPGIAGGEFKEGPASFQADYGIDYREEEDPMHDEVRKEVEAKRKAESEVDLDDAPREKRVKDSADAEPMDVEEASDAEFAEASGSEAGEAQEPQAGASPSDLRSVRLGVEVPESSVGGDDVRPSAGACDRAAGASVAPSLKHRSLPDLWDQGAIYYSLKMAETLHNDCESYVDAVRAKFPEVYQEEREETFQKLPHITMRFPGVTDLKAASGEEEQASVNAKAKLILPLSCPVPRKQSRYCDVGNQVQSTRASTALTEAVHSLAHGRAVRANDPEVLEYEAETRGVNSGFVMEGNLFARSTWQRFTLSALDARGMRTPEEEKRVLDQGLCMSHRVRNHMAASGERVRGVTFLGSTLATEVTWGAMERNKRKRADTAAGSSAENASSFSAQSRKRENEVNREVMEDALNVDNQFDV